MTKDAIRHTFLLHGLSPDELDTIASIAHVRDFMGGDTIVRQYAKGADICIVLQGSLLVKGGSGELLAECGPGSVIGEMALVDGKPRSATVVSKGPSKVAILAADDLWTLMKQDAFLARTILTNLSQILSMRLRHASIQLDLTHAKAPA